VNLDAVTHLLGGAVLSVVVDKIAVRIDEVRDDCVIHLSAQTIIYTNQEFAACLHLNLKSS